MDHQIIVFIIFGVIAIFNWLIRQGSKQGGGRVDKGSPPFTPVRRVRPTQVQSTESEEERTRKFLEALGVPSTNEPPRRIVRPVQQTVPPLVPRSQELPREGKVIPKQVMVARKAYVPPLPVPAIPQIPTPPPRLPEPSMATYEAVPPLLVPTAGITVPSSSISPDDVPPANLTDLQSLLRSPSSIRSAILLKEILGPPKSLQSAGAIPGFL
ncbi:MAG: hypothetical protein WCD79_08975 [Chthoniobacteraceae bacterium]